MHTATLQGKRTKVAADDERQHGGDLKKCISGG
jgi:hypothetical protein